MTVSTTLSRISYTEDGVSTVFPVPFRFLANADLVVERIISGVVTPLVLTTDYTVSGADAALGGSITRTAATNGATLRIRRQTPRTQSMVYTVGDDFPAESHERALDRLTLIAQEADAAEAETDGRALKVPPGEVISNVPAYASRLGRYLAFDALGSPVASVGTGNDTAFRSDVAASTGATLMGWIRNAIGAVSRTIASIFAERISVMDFGAKCDAVVDPVAKTVTGTDDKAAIQLAINHCLLGGGIRGRALKWPAGALSKISGSVMIDRAVDTTRGEFHIFGNGGGVVPTGAFACFDTTLRSPGDDDPASEDIVFHNFHWEAPDGDVDAYALGWRFLRIHLLGACQLRRIKLVYSPFYMQDWNTPALIAREWKGWLVKSHSNWFNCSFRDIRLENAPSGDGFLSEVGGMFGSRITGLAEGIRNFFQQAGSVKGEIDVYCEGNSGIDLTLSDIPNGGQANGMTISTVHVVAPANYASVNYWPIIMGDVRGSSFKGCWSNWNLFDTTHTPYPPDLSGNYATRYLYPGAGTGIHDNTRAGPPKPVLGTETGLWYGTIGIQWAGVGIVGAQSLFAGYELVPSGATNADDSLFVFHGPADPSGGGYGAAAFKKGCICWNSIPTTGQPIGWMCTVAGTPGTWKAMASLL